MLEKIRIYLGSKGMTLPTKQKLATKIRPSANWKKQTVKVPAALSEEEWDHRLVKEIQGLRAGPGNARDGGKHSTVGFSDKTRSGEPNTTVVNGKGRFCLLN